MFWVLCGGCDHFAILAVDDAEVAMLEAIDAEAYAESLADSSLG